MQATFLVGEQRSGSNLLRLMLANSGAIAAPHPPHILQRLDPIVPVGERLDEARFELVLEAVCQLVETNPVPWRNTMLHRADVRAACRKRSVVGLFGAVMDLYARANGAHAWMCKSMQNIRWAAELDACFPHGRYVYLHRDPRDVAVSFTKAVVGEKDVYFITRQWAELQRLCLDARRKVGPERFVTVSYADLTCDSERTLRGLCAWLGLEYRPEMLEFYDSEEARNTARASSLWENVARPVIEDNHEKFRRELTEQEIRVVESLAGREMDELGYARTLVPLGGEDTYSPEDVAAFKAENERRKRARAAATDPEDARKRARQESVLVELRSALAGVEPVTGAVAS
jgi:hypothetical protein